MVTFAQYGTFLGISVLLPDVQISDLLVCAGTPGRGRQKKMRTGQYLFNETLAVIDPFLAGHTRGQILPRTTPRSCNLCFRRANAAEPSNRRTVDAATRFV
jgi:hypothetical protein